MKITKLLLLLMLLQTTSTLFAQCATDTIFYIGSPGFGLDTAIIGSTEHNCMPNKCPNTDYCHSWQIDNFAGVLFIYGDSGSYLNVQVIDRCRFVVFDTCGFVQSFGSAAQTIRIEGVFPTDAQVVICGAIGDTAIPFVKPAFPTNLFQPIFDLDTCSILTSIASLQERKTIVKYYHPITMREVLKRLPNTKYLKRYSN